MARASMIHTIGHSRHPIDRFLALLGQHGITMLADVRSTPYSRLNPQFNRERLEQSLAAAGIGYVFLGEELGARTRDRSCYDDDRVDYRKLAATALFRQGLDRLQELTASHRVAMMCADKEPLDCHRTILVARELDELGVAVTHILANGTLEPHHAAMELLRRRLRLPERDLFRSATESFAEACDLQARKIAYVARPSTKPNP